MTSIEKLQRSFEVLRIPTQLYDSEQRKQDLKLVTKKDKINHLNLVYENVISVNVRQADDFSRNLGYAIEAFLTFFDDEDQDVYFVADECLNKTFKSLIDTCLTRFPADLYRFLRKNGSERSLKGALTRFAELCHLIKPHKCRIYVDFIIKENTLSKIANRTEESIQSVLVASMNRICSAFCSSMTDKEIKILIQSFLPNLSNDSSVNSYRRVSASCLSIICLYTRSPLSSYSYLHQELLNLILPIDENVQMNKYKIWGVLLCFRFMIIHIAELDKTSSTQITSSKIATASAKKSQNHFNLTNLCQIYEICIYYLNNNDLSIMTSALECLQVLLKLTPLKFNTVITHPGAFTNSYLTSEKKLSKPMNYESNLNSMSSLSKLNSSSDSLSTLRPLNQEPESENNDSINHQFDEVDPKNSTNQFIESPSKSIGSFYDEKNSSLNYLVRFLCSKFLLNTENENKIKSDQEVKILHKSIALDCCSSILTFEPSLIFLPLEVKTDSKVFISDLIDYINHQDDKMRSNACLLIGQFINTVLIINSGDYESWVSRHDPEDKLGLKLEILIDYLNRFACSENPKITNNICKRFALTSYRSFLPTLVKTNLSSYTLEVLINLIQLKNSTYNLVKCELVDLFASIDFKSITHTEQELSNTKPTLEDDYTEDSETKISPFYVRNTQERIIEEIFLHLIGSEDSKIRVETARCLTRFVQNMNFYEPTSIPFQNLLQTAGEYNLKSEGYSKNILNSTIIKNDAYNIGPISDVFEKSKHESTPTETKKIKYSGSPLSSVSFFSSIPWMNKNNPILVNNFVQPFYSLIKYFPSKISNSMTINNNLNKIIEYNLNYLVPLLTNTLLKSTDRYLFLGCLESLDFIFQTYQPGLFYSTNLIDLTNLLNSFLRHPNVSFDLYSHDILLRLVGNLFCSLSWLNMKKIDKLIQQLDHSVTNSLTNQTALVELITNSVKSVNFPSSLAEQVTGLSYSYSLSFNNQSLKTLIDQLFVHITKTLCVLACVIDESSLPSNLTMNLSAGSTAVNSAPTVQPTQATNPTQTSMTGSPSFIKSKITNLTDVKSPKQDKEVSTDPGVVPLMTQLPKTTNSVYLGHFQNSSHYLKLYETLKSAYNSYKKSPNVTSYDRFLQFLKTTLNLFAQLLESSLSVHEIAPHLDELLLYLKVIFSIEPSCSIKCVTICLKSLFGRNLAGLMFDFTQQQINRLSSGVNSTQTSTPGQSNLGSTVVLSGSLTSLTSFNLPPSFQSNPWPTSSKRQQPNLFKSLIQTNLAHFTRFMYTQTLTFKNDHLLGVQFNQNTSLINLGMDSMEYNLLPGPVIPTSSSQTSISSISSKTQPKQIQPSTGFNLFNFIKKSKNEPTQQATSTQQQNQLNQENKLKQHKTDLKTISQYIKSFESIVIKSLRQYTITTSVNLQTKILDLLIQLIFLNVDYCLLDSDKVFIDYVLKQFEFLEQKRIVDDPKNEDPSSTSLTKSYLTDLYENFDFETTTLDPLNPFDLDTALNKLYAHIENYYNQNSSSTSSGGSYGTSPLTCNLNLKQQEHLQAHLLIPKLFDFLIVLSHEKKIQSPSKNVSQTKPGRNSGLLTIPEIMQLCDNLIASENSPQTHSIPALRPLVMDLFLNRSNDDSKELEMQHDVIMMSMMRLINYPSVWPLLSVAVLKFKKDSHEKWKKSSRQICDAIFDSIKSAKLKFNEYNGYDLRSTKRYSLSYIPCIESVKLLTQLLSCLCPQVYRPIDSIILSLFESMKGVFTGESDLITSLCLLITHLFLLLTNASEDQLLIRLHSLHEQISLMCQEANVLMKNKMSTRKDSVDDGGDDNLDSASTSTNSSFYNLDEIDETEFDLSEPALFFAKFLLKLLEISFKCLKKYCRFNFSSFISAQNLASSSGTFFKDSDLNLFRDLHTIEHLISNQMQFLLYILSSGNFTKVAAALTKLVNFKGDPEKIYEYKKYKDSSNDQSENEDEEEIDDEIDDFGFNSINFIYRTNKFILLRYSKINPLLSSIWQYFLLLCHYQDNEYWLLSLGNFDRDYELDELGVDSSTSSSNNNSLNPNIQDSDLPEPSKRKTKIKKNTNQLYLQKIKILFHKHSKIPTLNEQLFKYLTLTTFCDNLNTNQNQLDATSGLTLLIINNLVDLFELASYEETVLDLFSSIHRNAPASSLFIQSINTNWQKIVSKNKLYLLESCLKSLEGVHLKSSGPLLNLLIEKFFNLPYLSLVRYADHIACQRVEMMQSLTTDELSSQMTDKVVKALDIFFDSQIKNGGRHQRLISLLDILKRDPNNETPSPVNSLKSSQSIEFFNIYLQNGMSKISGGLDKEWFYNIVRSACCYSSNTDLIDDSSTLKSKQCALILSNLDKSNCESIINDKTFRLNILKDCLSISASRTQSDIDNLPTALKQAKNILKDFTHPLWTTSTHFLFTKLESLVAKIPKPIMVSLSQTREIGQIFKDRFSSSNPVDLSSYEQKLNELYPELDFYTLINPLTESINSYLKSVRQFTCLDNSLKPSNSENLINFCLFQLTFINFVSSYKNENVSIQCLNQAFLCVYNVLIDQKFITIISQNSAYSTLVSYLIKDLYQCIIFYFLKMGDENLLATPRLEEKIEYFSTTQKISNDILFNPTSLETLLKLRFIVNNQNFRDKIPFLMRDLIEKIYIGLCRLPILDRFIRIPDLLWSQNFKLEYSQFLRSDTSALPPLDHLKDPHILKDHLRHILLIGWTTRNQFEYEYVNMLTFFHNISEDYYLPMSSQANSSEFLASLNPDQDPNLSQIITSLPNEEIKERNKCISLLIKGLSTWLIKSSLTPKSGNSLNSLYEQVSRNKSPGFLASPIGRQYGQIKKLIESFNRYNNFTNLNSISISNNSNLLFMLDPTMIDDSDRGVRPLLDFTQPQPPEALTNLIKISNNLSAKYNLLFTTNIERVMLNNLPTNTNSYFYFTQISLEGMLKFLGQWNRNESSGRQALTTIGDAIQNFVTNQIDEVSSKVAELLNDESNIPESNPNSSASRYEQMNNSFLIQRSFNRNSLDITSVLRTVLDYYESFFKIPSIQLKIDIFKCMLYLSNCLFDSRQQYESLSQKLQINFEFLNLFVQQESDPLLPVVNDLIDESTLSLGIYAECLCRCCLLTTRDSQGITSKEFDRLNKLVENGLKSNSLCIKISTVHGLIYWLESITLGYLSNTNDAKILIDHLCKQIYLMKDPTVYLTSNSRFISSLWSAVFYIIENCLDSIRDAQNFCSIFIKLTYQILNDPSTPYFLFYQLYLGLERLLLSCMVPSFEVNTIQKLFTSKLYDDQRTLCLISLTVTSLYATNPGKQMNYWHDIIGQQLKVSENTSSSNSPNQVDHPILKDSKISFPQILELNSYPDLQSHLLKVLEVATSFLDRMKSSSTSKEASLYASILPKILCDFLPPHDLLNKLITEFLNSSQHPYPEAVAYVLYKCFGLLQEKGMQIQIQEWCLLSLSNFLQRTRIHESIWLTSCLLVSASQNQWLKSTFPFLLNRYCAFETIDRAIFYMSVIEFMKQFDDTAQVKSIFSTFETYAKPDTPYEELVKLLITNLNLGNSE